MNNGNARATSLLMVFSLAHSEGRPHGLMVFIPTYWSFDPRRDLNWAEINKLHKARGGLRQGPKMSKGRLARHTQAQLAYQAAQRARDLGLRGAKRLEFIIKSASLPPGTEPRSVR